MDSGRVALSPPSTEEGEELRRLLDEYKGVTSRLVASHDTLRAQLAAVRLELAEKNRELERRKRLEALGRVAAGVAHEFRNPLGGIRLTVDTLRRELDGDRARERVERIARAVEHLDRIVGDLMNFTRETPLELRPHPIGALLDAAEEIAFAGVTDDLPEIARLGDSEWCLHVDRHAFVQVLANLLDNARRAMVGTGTLSAAGPHICFTWGNRERSAWLEISDRGPGIPDGEEERIFHPFHSLREGGTGLGLAIVHSRVESHGGAITVVEGKTGAPAGFEGARFRIELPTGGGKGE